MSAVAAVVEEEEAPATAPGYEFDDHFQRKIVALSMRDTVFAQRVDGLVDPAYFEQDADAHLYRLASDYFKNYRKTPDMSVIGVILKDMIAKKRLRKEEVPAIRKRLAEVYKTDISDRDFVVDKVVGFAR